MTLNEKTLKECPFCGANAKYEQDLRFEQASEDFPKWYVKCKKCGIKTPIATIPQVQALWNNRVR